LINICIFAIKIKKIRWACSCCRSTFAVEDVVVVVSSSRISIFNVVVADVVFEDVLFLLPPLEFPFLL